MRHMYSAIADASIEDNAIQQYPNDIQNSNSRYKDSSHLAPKGEGGGNNGRNMYLTHTVHAPATPYRIVDLIPKDVGKPSDPCERIHWAVSLNHGGVGDPGKSTPFPTYLPRSPHTCRNADDSMQLDL